MNNLSLFYQQLTTQQRVLLWAFVVLKVVLIFMLPLTGDEAYFITWGQMPALGYYDHPPAVGWVLALLGLVADNLVWYRFLAFVSAIVIAVLLYRLVLLHDGNSQFESQHNIAMWVGFAFFISPISLMFVVTANDTVLVLFSMLGVYFFTKNIQQSLWRDAIFAGVFLGLAFLSKYFAAFMLIGLLAYAIAYWSKVHKGQFGLMLALVLIAVAENLYFNATHCWNNILFNFFSRTEEAAFAPQNLVNFILMIALMLSPLGLWYRFRKPNNRQYFDALGSTQGISITKLAWFGSVPLLLVLAVVSLNNPIGLHWPLIAVTLLYLIYMALDEQQLAKLAVFNGYFSIAAAVLLIMALLNVDQLIKGAQKERVAVYTEPQKVCQILPTDQMVFTLDYSSQSALSYHCNNDQMHVFASTSKYGREDDKHTNFKALDGQNLTILVTKNKELKKVTPYFSKVEINEVKIAPEVTYYVVTGRGFNYNLYRQEVLLPVNEKFYTPPSWLGAISSRCEFKTKYDLP